MYVLASDQGFIARATVRGRHNVLAVLRRHLCGSITTYLIDEQRSVPWLRCLDGFLWRSCHCIIAGRKYTGRAQGSRTSIVDVIMEGYQHSLLSTNNVKVHVISHLAQ